MGVLPADADYVAHAASEVAAGTIYVVVPVFNRKLLTERFLCCMRDQTFRNFKIIVVDDGSTDGTSVLIAEKFPEVQLLRGDGTLWWTGAINVGIRHAMAQAAEADAVLVINDDLEVDTDYLDALCASWKAMPHTLIGSLIVDIDNPEIIEDGGRVVNWWTAKCRVLNAKRTLRDFPKHHYVHVSILTGWGTLIPVQVFRDLGLYDDKHFQQCGDTELPVRAGNAGYDLVVSYAAVAKVHLSACDGVNVATHYSLRDLKRYFFGIKSNFRLKYRFFFGLSAAKNPVIFASFLLCDLARITGHFLTRVRFLRE
jgi:N-acetylglucosaminyl-diphospho-decaprenol L-rhamnosyltransferase